MNSRLKTSLSVGALLRAALLEDEAVIAMTRQFVPVIVNKAQLPYVVCARTALACDPVKQRAGADTVSITMLCCGASYEESLNLAEAVRGALDGVQLSDGTLTIRSCQLINADESYDSDAYIQRLIFKIKL